MRWKGVVSSYPPVVAALCLASMIALVYLSKPPQTKRLSRQEKKESRRQSRKRARAITSKRVSCKQRFDRMHLLEQIGLENFKQKMRQERQLKEDQLVKLQAARESPDALEIVVDLSVSDVSSPKEISSLAKQLCYVYARMKKKEFPPKLALTSFKGRAAEALLSAGAGSWLVTRSEQDVFNVFDNRNLIYLSPDADEILDEVSTSNVYVVGGSVDRNISKGLSLAAAEGGRSRAVRLPFEQYLPEVSPRDRVLTVCACAGVLMNRHGGQSWREVLEAAVPRRGKGNLPKGLRGGAYRGTDGSSWGSNRDSLKLAIGAQSTCVDGAIVPRTQGGEYIKE